VVEELGAGRSPGEVAARFHATIAAAIERVCMEIRDRTGLRRAVLSGGVFANDLLLTDAVERLERGGFEVLVPREVPPGDGGIALGQVMVAQARLGGDG
jgi:hydrogenase maturation protein HypF